MTPVLAVLFWLPVKSRITFKLMPGGLASCHDLLMLILGSTK